MIIILIKRYREICCDIKACLVNGRYDFRCHKEFFELLFREIWNSNGYNRSSTIAKFITSTSMPLTGNFGLLCWICTNISMDEWSRSGWNLPAGWTVNASILFQVSPIFQLTSMSRVLPSARSGNAMVRSPSLGIKRKGQWTRYTD